MPLQRFVVHIPRWLRWSLLVVLGVLVLGFSLGFFLGIGRPEYREWAQPSVSIVQIALTGLAYVTLLFFTESGQSPRALQARSDAVLTRLLPDSFARITDTQGVPLVVEVGAGSGIVGRAYALQSPNTRLRLWVGLNVHRAIVAYFCELPDGEADDAFRSRLRRIFENTINGARAVGYDEPNIQIEQIDGYRFASIWLTWNLEGKEDFLTHPPTQLFFAQDVALMTQSFLRTAQRHGIRMATPIEPMPL
jgi:hypothetical protein